MMDPKLVVAEMRAGELLCALQKAVDYQEHWLLEARALLDEINNMILPDEVVGRLRELDGLKRSAEIMEDACHG